MGDDDVAFAILYDGSFVRKDNGAWEYANYKSKTTSVGKGCTKSELEDEIYECLEVDQNENQIILKYIYTQCCMNLEPMEIRRDRDVRTFLVVVRSSTTRTPLCVEVIPKVQQFALDDGSDRLSCACASTNVRSTVGDALCNNQVPETQDHQDIFPKTVVPETKLGDRESEVDVGLELHDVGCNDVELDGGLQDNNNDVHTEMKKDVYHATSSRVYRRRWMDVLSSKKFISKDSIVAGQIFQNKKELQSKLGIHCMHANKEFKVKRSTTERYEVECLENTCNWRLRAAKLYGEELFIIKMFDDVHTCSLEVMQREHKQASSRLIGQCIKAKYKGNPCVYKPKEIQHEIQQQFGVKISYYKAWKARALIMSNKIDVIERGCSLCGGIGHNRLRCKNSISNDPCESSRPCGAGLRP